MCEISGNPADFGPQFNCKSSCSPVQCCAISGVNIIINAVELQGLVKLSVNPNGAVGQGPVIAVAAAVGSSQPGAFVQVPPADEAIGDRGPCSGAGSGQPVQEIIAEVFGLIVYYSVSLYWYELKPACCTRLIQAFLQTLRNVNSWMPSTFDIQTEDVYVLQRFPPYGYPKCIHNR